MRNTMPEDCSRDVDAVLTAETDSMIPHYADEVERIVKLIRQFHESKPPGQRFSHQDVQQLLRSVMTGAHRLEL
jgi:hypothetical protein